MQRRNVERHVLFLCEDNACDEIDKRLCFIPRSLA